MTPDERAAKIAGICAVGGFQTISAVAAQIREAVEEAKFALSTHVGCLKGTARLIAEAKAETYADAARIYREMSGSGFHEEIESAIRAQAKEVAG